MSKDIRPQTLKEFIGKQREKDLIELTVKGALKRQTACDHVLLGGNAGLGKTTLAHIIKNELGVKIVSTLGNNVNQSILGAICTLEDNDILFIDEIHRVPNKFQEILYPAMEDGRASVTVGSRIIDIKLPKFTLIGATTEPATLTKPFRDRFGLVINLEPYTYHEMIRIALRSIGIFNIDSNNYEGLAEEVAKRSRSTPRVCNNILKRIRDVAVTTGQPIEVSKLDSIFDLLGIDADGLDSDDYRYLKTLKKYSCPVGVDNMSASTGIDRGTIEKLIEPFLLNRGFIMRTPQGRVLAESGDKKLKEEYM